MPVGGSCNQAAARGQQNSDEDSEADFIRQDDGQGQAAHINEEDELADGDEGDEGEDEGEEQEEEGDEEQGTEAHDERGQDAEPQEDDEESGQQPRRVEIPGEWMEGSDDDPLVHALCFATAHREDLDTEAGAGVIHIDIQRVLQIVRSGPMTTAMQGSCALQLLHLASLLGAHAMTETCLMLAGSMGEHSRFHDDVCTESAAVSILELLRELLEQADQWLNLVVRAGVKKADALRDPRLNALRQENIRLFIAYDLVAADRLCPPLQVFLAKQLPVLLRWRQKYPRLAHLPAKFSRASGNMLRELLLSPVRQPVLFLSAEESKVDPAGIRLKRGTLIELDGVTENRQLIAVCVQHFDHYGANTQMHNWTALDPIPEAPTRFAPLQLFSCQIVFQEGIPADICSLKCPTTLRLASALWQEASQALFTFFCVCHRRGVRLSCLHEMVWKYLVDADWVASLRNVGLPVVLISHGMIARQFRYQGGVSKTFPAFNPKITVLREVSESQLEDLARDISRTDSVERVRALKNLLGTGAGDADVAHLIQKWQSGEGGGAEALMESDEEETTTTSSTNNETNRTRVTTSVHRPRGTTTVVLEYDNDKEDAPTSTTTFDTSVPALTAANSSSSATSSESAASDVPAPASASTDTTSSVPTSSASSSASNS